MLIEIVSHCFAEELPQYAACLHYQICSLVLQKPTKVQVCLTVCFCASDERTLKVIRNGNKLFSKYKGLQLAVKILPRNEIGRRSIGRNKVAMGSIGDIIWFADVDQVFRDGILDRLGTMEWPGENAMVFPKEIMIHQDHATGDERTSAVDLDHLEFEAIKSKEFVPKKYNRAIGGVQIVRGDFAREHGYLNHDGKWQQPTDKPFGDFRDDIAYRNFCSDHGGVIPIDLPGLCRLRHTRITYQ